GQDQPHEPALAEPGHRNDRQRRPWLRIKDAVAHNPDAPGPLAYEQAAIERKVERPGYLQVTHDRLDLHFTLCAHLVLCRHPPRTSDDWPVGDALHNSDRLRCTEHRDSTRATVTRMNLPLHRPG